MRSYIFFKIVNKGRVTFSMRLDSFKLNLHLIRVQDTLGITSGKPFDIQHGIFWDFVKDYNRYDVIDSLISIQKEYRLGTIYPMQTGSQNSFRAICPNVIPYDKSVEIIMRTKGIDKWFAQYFIKYGYKTIRILPKSKDNIEIRPMYPIKSENYNTPICTAISFVLQKLFGYRVSGNFDSCKPRDVTYIAYETQLRK